MDPKAESTGQKIASKLLSDAAILAALVVAVHVLAQKWLNGYLSYFGVPKAVARSAPLDLADMLGPLSALAFFLATLLPAIGGVFEEKTWKRRKWALIFVLALFVPALLIGDADDAIEKLAALGFLGVIWMYSGMFTDRVRPATSKVGAMAFRSSRLLYWIGAIASVTFMLYGVVEALGRQKAKGERSFLAASDETNTDKRHYLLLYGADEKALVAEYDAEAKRIKPTYRMIDLSGSPERWILTPLSGVKVSPLSGYEEAPPSLRRKTGLQGRERKGTTRRCLRCPCPSCRPCPWAWRQPQGQPLRSRRTQARLPLQRSGPHPRPPP